MKKHVISLLSALFLFGNATQLVPVTLEAHEQHQETVLLAEQLEETLTEDENGKQIVDMQKVQEFGFEALLPELQIMADEENELRAGTTAYQPTIGAVLEALGIAGLQWLVRVILDHGVYLACTWYGVTMYRHSIAGRYNPGSYLFYTFCASKGW